MNIANMMKQAQQMQKKLQEAQNELSKAEIIGEASNGVVSVTLDGQARFKSIKIKPEAINPENPESVDTDLIETLEDLVSTAMQQATSKALTQLEARMKSVTGGISIPGLF